VCRQGSGKFSICSSHDHYATRVDNVREKAGKWRSAIAHATSGHEQRRRPHTLPKWANFAVGRTTCIVAWFLMTQLSRWFRASKCGWTIHCLPKPLTCFQCLSSSSEVASSFLLLEWTKESHTIKATLRRISHVWRQRRPENFESHV
jgi:hypothetical protein